MNEINMPMQPIGERQLTELTKILQEYKAGKSNLEKRVQSSEQWWKLRNTSQESSVITGNGFKSKSGWTHNVICSKHADAMEAYPEANLLPREEGDKEEAKMLSSIIPCILEQNHFEDTYSDVMWSKMKSGTGVYKITWSQKKLNGLGDVEITPASLLNLFWESGISDIQKSKYFFHTELVDKDVLTEAYPELFPNGVKNDAFTATKFLYDDKANTDNKATVIEVYYHKNVNGRDTLQYIQYVGDVVIYATENDPEMLERGLYDHCKYPYVFDSLFPVEGSPCGYGYVDLCQNPQTEIDLLKTAFVQNARAGARTRYFSANGGNINETEFLDYDKGVVHVEGRVEDATVKVIDHKSVDGSFLNLLDWDVNELRETSGNTETSTGSVPSGVTSGAAIAALQTASGKGSKDSTKASYRKFSQVIEFVVELIRQFYDIPRKFRILGQHGMEQFVSYNNARLQPQPQMSTTGEMIGMRLPVFDIKISAQTKNVYTKLSQNELAIQFFQLGFFNPQTAEMSLMALGMMDFDGKDALMQKISQNAMMFQKLQQYMQMALMTAPPEMQAQIAADMQQTLGITPQVPMRGANLGAEDDMGKEKTSEAPTVEKARERAEMASQPV